MIKHFSRRLITAFYGLTITIFVIACNGAPANDSNISQQALLERINTGTPPLILDVRSTGEYHSGHVPGAINIPHTALASRIDELQTHKDNEIVVYCERGVRAGVANDILAQSGFSKLRHLSGDMSSWRSNKLPMEK